MTSHTMSSMSCGSPTGASQLPIDRRWTTRRLRHDADRATHQINNGPTAIAWHAAQSPLSPMPAAPLPPTPAARTWRSTRAAASASVRHREVRLRPHGGRDVERGRSAPAAPPYARRDRSRTRRCVAAGRKPQPPGEDPTARSANGPIHCRRYRRTTSATTRVRPAGRTASTRHQVRRTVVHTTPPDSHNWPVHSHRPLGGAAADTRHEGGAR